MGRTFSPAVTAAPVIVGPVESHDEMYPHYPRWSYENPWDPDSDAFFKDAVYEAPVPALPLEPITPVESSDGSSLDSSGRATPAELPPVPGQISPLNQDMELWFEGTSPGGNPAAAIIDGLPPLPTPRRHSTSELRSIVTQPHFVSSAAFERFYARQFNRARAGSGGGGGTSQHFSALVTDGDSDADAPVSLRPGVSVRTSEITPIQLPSSHPRAAISVALQHPRLARPLTPPPPASPSSSGPVPTTTPSGEAMQPSPPPSVSPRIYNWPPAAHSAPESPTLPSRIRVTPARWPVY
ncbi:hypothetical protein DFH94DRAFT_695176 [Russula ochroleuca]|jgi:hypothetical protein|uniref:Uncharacterized protein n=1 Tax=Russula ochroleuca TaxID=152965 RepID=A0A9P5MMN4_9AGAM|nr:hypothetical protein DFH94DRAFT_135640 [Russula ochroleuca]KAF8475162.1 hypothetical protein DFH94DRAFT_695176 [Russula ochroleuca]